MRKQPTPEQRRCSPVDEPGAGVVRPEADRDVVVCGGRARRDGVAPDGITVVVRGRAGAAHHREDVLSERGIRLV